MKRKRKSTLGVAANHPADPTPDIHRHSLPILAERQKVHGSFIINATYSQQLKERMRRVDLGGWERLSHDQRESLELIATKISRILSGDRDHEDHWRDIAGYATLIADKLKPRN